MGCVPSDGGCNTDERPRHQVTLTKPFDMMTTEVTIGMYRAVAPTVEEQPAWSATSSHPVVIVTWEEARRFCKVIGGGFRPRPSGSTRRAAGATTPSIPGETKRQATMGARPMAPHSNGTPHGP